VCSEIDLERLSQERMRQTSFAQNIRHHRDELRCFRTVSFPAELARRGRMLPEQKAYIYAWVDAITAAGFRAGVYSSAIPWKNDNNVVTSVDIREHAGSRAITYWAINDACPPAPGCAFPQPPPSPAQSGIAFAEVWQFAQSPRRKDVAAKCTNYSPDGNCYPPGSDPTEGHIDVNTATSPDPSHARTH